MAAAHALDALFAPRSVAVIGASGDPNKIGGRPIAFLKQGAFAGPIHPINPNASEVQGLRAYATLDAAPGPVDHAIIAVPPKAALDAMRACVAKGVKVAQIFSAGFGEIDAAGRALQEEIVALARAGGVRVVGPNSLGAFNVAAGFFGTFATALDGAWPAPGTVAFATQSGAFGSYSYGIAQGRGLGFSHFVATGNEADVELAECIEWLADDAATRVIVATFEGCRDGRRLIAALERARANGKPVVVMKAGATEAGAQAAATHTGSLAGSDAVFDGIFAQCNAYRARSLDELIDVAYCLSRQVLPEGNRLGVVTTSGGIGVLIADAASERGLVLPPLPEAAGRAVRELLPHASAANPLDTTAAVINDTRLVARSLEFMLADAECDSVIAFLAHMGRNPDHWNRVKTPLFELRAKYPAKAFALCLLGPPAVHAEAEAGGFVVFEDPTRAVAAIGAAARLAKGLRRRGLAPLDGFGNPAGNALHIPPGALDEAESKRLVQAAGIAVPIERVATTRKEAVIAAEAVGGPVAMKILSPDVAHKSDVGGVRLGIADAHAAGKAFDEMMAVVKAARPDADLEGVLVTPMIEGGVQTVLGVVADPVFGPVVMFGSGGVLVEALEDVTFRAAPFDSDVAESMIDVTLVGRLLHGVRGARPADRRSLVDTLVRLSRFAYRYRDRIAGIDINPYVVLEDGGVALDALVVPRAVPTEEESPR